MRLLKAVLFLLIVIPMIVVVPSGTAQRLYDKRRDEQAQEAKKYIDPLLSGSVFDTQLKNLALLSKQDLAALLLGAQYEMRSTVNDFTSWREINCYVAGIKARVLKKDKQPKEADRIKLIQELKDKITAAKNELLRLQAEAACKKDPKGNFTKCLPPKQAAACEQLPDPKPDACVKPDATAVESFFEGVGEFEELEKQVKSLETKALSLGVIEAGEKVKEVLNNLEKVYTGYRQRMEEYNKKQGELLDLRITLKQVALQTLQVEEEHLKTIGEIRARREVEEGEIEELISDYEDFNGQLDLGYETDTKCFCRLPATESENIPAREICGTAEDSDAMERNVEMTLRDAVAQARNAEASFAEAEEALQKAQPDLEEARARWREEEESLRQAIENAKGRARRRAESAHQRALKEFQKQETDLENAITAAQQNLRAAKQNVLATRDVVQGLLFTLHLATSLASYGRLPESVAKQREKQEDHAFSIRLSRVRARAYQLTVSTGVQRLGLYHKGGIKPSLVARLIHAASTVAISPILAAK